MCAVVRSIEDPVGNVRITVSRRRAARDFAHVATASRRDAQEFFARLQRRLVCADDDDDVRTRGRVTSTPIDVAGRYMRASCVPARARAPNAKFSSRETVGCATIMCEFLPSSSGIDRGRSFGHGRLRFLTTPEEFNELCLVQKFPSARR